MKRNLGFGCTCYYTRISLPNIFAGRNVILIDLIVIAFIVTNSIAHVLMIALYSASQVEFVTMLCLLQNGDQIKNKTTIYSFYSYAIVDSYLLLSVYCSTLNKRVERTVLNS